MNIGLIGWGVETKSAFAYYGNEHNYLIVNEEPRDDFPTSENVQVQTLPAKRQPGLSGNAIDMTYMEGIEQCDKIIFSPSARKNLEKIFSEGSEFWNKATTTLNIFFDVCPTKNTIGITGTKGKGTTTTLIAEMIRADGRVAHVGGNIGIPVLSLLPDIAEDDWVVLELSSFQIYKFNTSPHIAVHLMMIPEHIDEWHKTMDDYVEAKANIFKHQTVNDIAIYNPFNEYATNNSLLSRGKKIPYMTEPGAHVENDTIMIDNQVITTIDDIGLKGAHNRENICAAITAVWNIHNNTTAMSKVIKDFTGLEHRLQLVRVMGGVSYYDDSFGTTPDTTIVALDAFKQSKVLMLGGHDKGNDFTRLISRLQGDDIRHIIAIGSTGNKVAEALIDTGLNQSKISYKSDYNNWTMDEMVSLAGEKALDDDIILLSTGSASFGIFNDYKDRGDQFIAQVNQLNEAPSQAG